MELLLQVKIVFFLLVLVSMLHAEFIYRVENTNFTLSQASVLPGSTETYLYNYDRLRFRGDYIKDNFFLTFIGDGVNYYGEKYLNSSNFAFIKLRKSDTPFKTQSHFNDYGSGSIYAKLYRLYGGYEDDTNRVVIGQQNIPMGVGHVWNPTNLFNPRNVYALEPDETFGVLGISYTRHFSQSASVTGVISQKADKSLKYAAQYKAFLDFMDVGVDVLSSNETNMLGYELEGNLGKSGVEVRSEGAYIQNRLKKSVNTTEEVAFFQGIVGADYGFVNGVSLMVESLYSSKSFSYARTVLNYDSEIAPNLVNSNLYAAASLAYTFNIYLDGSILYLDSFDFSESQLITPSLTYTLNDYNSLTAGAMLQNYGDTYYLKWVFSF